MLCIAFGCQVVGITADIAAAMNPQHGGNIFLSILCLVDKESDFPIFTINLMNALVQPLC